MPEIYCRKCGTIVRPTDLFCRRCGFPLDSTTVAEEGTQDTKPEQGREGLDGSYGRSSLGSSKSRRTACLMAAVGFLSLTLALVVIFFVFLTNQPGGRPAIAIELVGTSTSYPTRTPYFTATLYRIPTIYPIATPYPTTGVLWQQYKTGCKLIIKNQNTYQDSVIVLSNVNTKSIVAAVYVRASDSFTFTGFPTGTYDTYFAMGRDWDTITSRFDNNAKYYRFEEPDTFDTCPSGNYGSYQYLEITIHITEGSGSDTINVQPDSFPIIAP